jgi:hypothetical protein
MISSSDLVGGGYLAEEGDHFVEGRGHGYSKTQ